MKDTLPVSLRGIYNSLSQYLQKAKGLFGFKEIRYPLISVLGLILIGVSSLNGSPSAANPTSPAEPKLKPLESISQTKSSKEVFGFAPYWNINKLENVDFKVLTTLAYFGIEVGSDGNLVKNDPGYNTFKSSQTTELFKKAHSNGTRVVLTLTQMDNSAITQIMDNPEAQSNVINQAVELVKQRGIDGVNIDFEYAGDPGQYYKDRFTQFVSDMTNKMHQEVPGSKVTVSVYASAIKDPKIYDIGAIGNASDGIFMMAYDFAVAKSDNAIPTAPLYGHESGKYWYDIATAVADFLKFMPAEKLILGVPYYGYNYIVSEPTIKAPTTASAVSNTYTVVQDSFNTDLPGVDQVIQGWDDDGKVGYYAYRIASSGAWRMIFMEDTKSLSIKYDFAKGKNLGGVGIWALGNDEGKQELWSLLKEKFGAKQLAGNLSTDKVKEIYD